MGLSWRIRTGREASWSRERGMRGKSSGFLERGSLKIGVPWKTAWSYSLQLEKTENCFVLKIGSSCWDWVVKEGGIESTRPFAIYGAQWTVGRFWLEACLRVCNMDIWGQDGSHIRKERKEQGAEKTMALCSKREAWGLVVSYYYRKCMRSRR